MARFLDYLNYASKTPLTPMRLSLDGKISQIELLFLDVFENEIVHSKSLKSMMDDFLRKKIIPQEGFEKEFFSQGLCPGGWYVNSKIPQLIYWIFLITVIYQNFSNFSGVKVLNGFQSKGSINCNDVLSLLNNLFAWEFYKIAQIHFDNKKIKIFADFISNSSRNFDQINNRDIVLSVISKYDHNGSLASAEDVRIMNQYVKKGAVAIRLNIDSLDEIINIVNVLKRNNNHFKAFVVNAHGSANSIVLSKFERITPCISYSKSEMLVNLFKQLDENCQVYLCACETAGVSRYPGSDNLATYISKINPKITIIASSSEMGRGGKIVHGEYLFNRNDSLDRFFDIFLRDIFQFFNLEFLLSRKDTCVLENGFLKNCR